MQEEWLDRSVDSPNRLIDRAGLGEINQSIDPIPNPGSTRGRATDPHTTETHRPLKTPRMRRALLLAASAVLLAALAPVHAIPGGGLLWSSLNTTAAAANGARRVCMYTCVYKRPLFSSSPSSSIQTTIAGSNSTAVFTNGPTFNANQVYPLYT
jgi:hypothetical protein